MGLISKILKIMRVDRKEPKVLDSEIARGSKTALHKGEADSGDTTHEGWDGWRSHHRLRHSTAGKAKVRPISPKYLGIINERGFPIFSFLVPCSECHRRALKHCKIGVCHERTQAFMVKCRMEEGWYRQMCKEVYL